ncbi:hypothetical protein ALQ37_05539 [Pseudomonas syringae pv. aptata]|uniref:Secreted protein n=1 Tax=Pseudomonas syringae pv. aptata TaxID=83167 RepID=A0A3M3WW46_PSEAP|nr:hypothetical protein ALQ37_05539 [Pseudomonas syringae pv. aptata]
MITGVKVRFLLLFALALQVAFADVDAGVNTDASRTDGDTGFPSAIFTGVFGGAVVLCCLDIEGVAGIQIDVSLCLSLRADQVEVIAGLDGDVTTCLQRSNGRGLLTLITFGDAAAATHAEFEPATAAAVDTTPAFLLAGFLAVAAFGGIKRDIPAFDVDVAASLQLTAADLNVVARGDVQVVASVQRRGAVGRFDHLLAGALLAVTELSIARRARQELRGAVYCLERARSLARSVLTLACAADGVLGAAIVVINARTQTITRIFALLLDRLRFTRSINLDIAPGGQIDVIERLKVRTYLIDVALGIDCKVFACAYLAGGSALLLKAVLLLGAINACKEGHAVGVRGHADTRLPVLLPVLIGLGALSGKNVDVLTRVQTDIRACVDAAADNVDIALGLQTYIACSVDLAAYTGAALRLATSFFSRRDGQESARH